MEFIIIKKLVTMDLLKLIEIIDLELSRIIFQNNTKDFIKVGN